MKKEKEILTQKILQSPDLNISIHEHKNLPSKPRLVPGFGQETRGRNDTRKCPRKVPVVPASAPIRACGGRTGL